MIVVFDRDETDFSANGLGPLDPISCVVAETLNGQWELTLVHAWDETKSPRLQIGNIIRAPVPAGYTPAITINTPGEGENREIWRVSTGGEKLNLRAGPGTDYRVIRAYANGTEVTVIEKTNSSWYEVTAPDGKHGWMVRANLRYVRDEEIPTGEDAEVVEAKQLRDQLFRIYRLEPGLTTLTVKARHIFYDLLSNILDTYAPENATGSTVAQAIMSHCRGSHAFTMYSDVGTTGGATFTDKNPVEAILGSGGLCETWNAELARDWWDIYIVPRVGRDTNVEIRQGKNMMGLYGEIDISDTATRIIPVGRTSGGDPLYLPEIYVENTNGVNDYGAPRWMKLDRSDIKVGSGVTQSKAYDLLRDAAQQEFDKGRDEIGVALEVDFINLGDTVEYADYGILYDISIGDSVRVISPTAGIDVRLRMTEYEYDCIAKRYTVMRLEEKPTVEREAEESE